MFSWSGNDSFKRGNCAPPDEETIIRHRCPIPLSTSVHNNLTRLSKNLEKVISQQLLIHNDHMSEVYQSAYKPQHSTETILVCVCEDIKKALERKKMVQL